MEGTQRTVKNAMIREVRIDPEKYLDSSGCFQYTALAEWAAWEIGQDTWLDDETHFVWDLAVDVGDLYALNH